MKIEKIGYNANTFKCYYNINFEEKKFVHVKKLNVEKIFGFRIYVDKCRDRAIFKTEIFSFIYLLCDNRRL